MTNIDRAIKYNNSLVAVRKIQDMIVKHYNKDSDKYIKYQNILLNDKDAQYVACYNTIQGPGANIAGVDNELWQSSKIDRYVHTLDNIIKKGSHKLSKVFIKRIPNIEGPVNTDGTPNITIKPVKFLPMIDRAFLNLHELTLSPIHDIQAPENKFKYVTSILPSHATCSLFESLSSDLLHVVQFSLNDFYKNINVDSIIDYIPMDKSVLLQLFNNNLLSRYYEHIRVNAGNVPRIGSIHTMIANYILHGIEEFILESLNLTEKQLSDILQVIRIGDQLIVAFKTKELSDQVIPLIKTFLAVRGIKLCSKSMKFINLKENPNDLQFLGFQYEYKKHNDNDCVRFIPSLASLCNFKHKVDYIFNNFSDPYIIYHLNIVIRPWLTYFRFHESTWRIINPLPQESYPKITGDNMDIFQPLNEYIAEKLSAKPDLDITYLMKFK